MKYKDIVLSIKKKNFLPIYFLSGDEKYFIDDPNERSTFTEVIKIIEDELSEKEIKEKNESVENMEQIPLATIEPMPNELVSKIQIPKPKLEEKKIKEDPVKLPPLPSVFQDIKPVKKIVPKYPPSAEEEKMGNSYN